MAAILLLFILVTVFVIYFAWNWLTLRGNRRDLNIEVERRFYELKSKNDFLLASGSLITAVCIFIGISTQKELKQTLLDNFISYKNSVDSINIVFENRTKKLTGELDTMKLVQNQISSDQGTNKNQILYDRQSLIKNSQELNRLFNDLNKKYIALANNSKLKKDFYIIKVTAYFKTRKIYFKDTDLLSGLPGAKLPNFKEPPLLIPASKTAAQILITEVTKDFMEVQLIAGDEKKGADFNLIVYY